MSKIQNNVFELTCIKIYGKEILKTVQPNTHLKYYLRSHRCPKFRPSFRVSVFPFVTLFCHTSEFYHERLPGGARQNPRSGFFLVS